MTFLGRAYGHPFVSGCVFWQDEHASFVQLEEGRTVFFKTLGRVFIGGDPNATYSKKSQFTRQISIAPHLLVAVSYIQTNSQGVPILEVRDFDIVKGTNLIQGAFKLDDECMSNLELLPGDQINLKTFDLTYIGGYPNGTKNRSKLIGKQYCVPKILQDNSKAVIECLNQHESGFYELAVA